MNFKIAVLRGDGIGPEITDEALRVLHGRRRQVPARVPVRRGVRRRRGVGPLRRASAGSDDRDVPQRRRHPQRPVRRPDERGASPEVERRRDDGDPRAAARVRSLHEPAAGRRLPGGALALAAAARDRRGRRHADRARTDGRHLLRRARRAHDRRRPARSVGHRVATTRARSRASRTARSARARTARRST